MSKRTFFTPADKRFGKKWWLANARTLFWVVLVTTLIWIYADIEFTDTTSLRCTIELTVGNSDKLVLIDDDGSSTSKIDKEIAFEIKGSAAELDKYRRELTKKGMKLSFDLSESRGVGSHSINIADILNTSDRLGRAGISILLAEPTSIAVNIDEIIHKTLPVRFQYHGATVDKYIINKKDIKVSATSSDWQKITRKLGTKKDMMINTRQVDLSKHPSGKAVTAELLPFVAGVENIKIRLETDTVDVTVNIADRFAEKTLEVTVRILIPYTWTQPSTVQNYLLKTKDSLVWRKEITVTGATAKIEALKAQDIDAYIVLNAKDLTQGEIFDRIVKFRFPAGIKLKPETRHTISFKPQKKLIPG